MLADALTSVLAILALLAAKYFGYMWMDPLMGIVGAVLVTGDGSLLTVSETQNAELLPAVRLGLGALGILVELESGVMGVVDLLRLDPDGRRGDGWESVPRVGESVEMVVVGVDNDVWYTLSMRRAGWLLKERWLEYAPRVEVGAVVPSVAGSSGAMIDATMFC